MCVSFVDLCSGHRSQKKISEPLELELQVVVSHPVWVLGTKLGSSARATNAFNC